MSKQEVYLISNEVVVFNETLGESNPLAKKISVDVPAPREGYVTELVWDYEAGTAEYKYVEEEGLLTDVLEKRLEELEDIIMMLTM